MVHVCIVIDVYLVFILLPINEMFEYINWGNLKPQIDVGQKIQCPKIKMEKDND